MSLESHGADPGWTAGPMTSAGEPAPRELERAARPRRVAIFGFFGAGNHGNEGSLEAMLDMLRRERPKIELICVCADPIRVAEDYGIGATPLWPSRDLAGAARRLHRLLFRIPGKVFDLVGAYRTMRRCDVMIVPGTGILDDFCERPVGMPLTIFLWCLAARAAGARLCMVSIGAGPIRHPLSRQLMLGAARFAHFRSYRDQVSKTFMTKAGIDTRRDPVEPDLVFKLRVPATDGPQGRPAGRPSIGVGLMGYRGWYGFEEDGAAIFDAYMNKMARVVGHLLREGYDVRLLVGDLDDRTAIQTILDRASGAAAGGGILVAEPISSLHDLMGQIARTDIVIATRFHNVVCALKMSKPTISLGYARKNDVLMGEMGLYDYCHHVEHFEPERLIVQLAELIARREDVGARIAARIRAFSDRLDRQDRHLLSRYLLP